MRTTLQRYVVDICRQTRFRIDTSRGLQWSAAAQRTSPAAHKKYPEEVGLVMAATDCGDADMVLQTLVENLYDVRTSLCLLLKRAPINAGLNVGASRHRLHSAAPADAGRPLHAQAAWLVALLSL
jgi:hypothetical protein